MAVPDTRPAHTLDGHGLALGVPAAADGHERIEGCLADEVRICTTPALRLLEQPQVLPQRAEPDHVGHLVEDGLVPRLFGQPVHVGHVEEHRTDDGKAGVGTDLTGAGAPEDASRAVDVTDVDVDQKIVDDAVAGDLQREAVPGKALLERVLEHGTPGQVAGDRLLPVLLRLLESGALGLRQRPGGRVDDVDAVHRGDAGRAESDRINRAFSVHGPGGQPVGRTCSRAQDPLVHRGEAIGVGDRAAGDCRAAAARLESHSRTGDAVAVGVLDLHLRPNGHRKPGLGLLAVTLDGFDTGCRPGQSERFHTGWIPLDSVSRQPGLQRVDPGGGPQGPTADGGASRLVRVRRGSGDHGIPIGTERHCDSRERRTIGVGHQYLWRHRHSRSGRDFLVHTRDHGDLGGDAEGCRGKDDRWQGKDCGLQLLGAWSAQGPWARRRDPVGSGGHGGRVGALDGAAPHCHDKVDRDAGKRGARPSGDPYSEGIGDGSSGRGGLPVAREDLHSCGRIRLGRPARIVAAAGGERQEGADQAVDRPPEGFVGLVARPFRCAPHRRPIPARTLERA